MSGLTNMERRQTIRRLREDEAHRALGHYVFAFAYLVSEMREAVEYALSKHDLDGDRMDARLAMGAAFAEQIANAFFAICERYAELDDEERQVAIRLKKEVKDAIADRNDFAHGDWSVLWPNQGPTLSRIKPGRRAGPLVKQERSAEEIDSMARSVEELADTTTEFALICFGLHPVEERTGTAVRVRDIYRFRKHRVLRIGRYADLPWSEWEEEMLREEEAEAEELG
ncbi:MAG: hypothetical protein ACTHK6_00155 [Solirubrobacterales bacterium]